MRKMSNSQVKFMKPYSLDLRQKIVSAYINGEGTFRQIARKFKISLSYVYRIIKQFLTLGRLVYLPIGGGPKPKLDSYKDLIFNYIEECNDLTLSQLCDRLEKETQVKVSIATMCRFLQKHKITRKKKTTYAPKAQTDEIQLARVEYWQKIIPFDFKNLVFLDETGIQLGITQSYARSDRGKRAYGVAPYPHGNILTLIGAISFEKVVNTMTVDGGINGKIFLTFVKKMLVPKLWAGACVIADNLPAHYATGVKEAIESVGAKLVYLSAYSPDFNPIENWWSKLKSFLRKIKPQTREEIEAGISEGIDMVTPDDLQHWFTHCCYFS